ncbi:MAG TPA: hypothetical protein VL981_11760, partial [Candidatus Methylacidiphilales bacterium]|nr:hypothetical protein [Candidatus Methylacidiphilales bacterium]
GPEYDIIGKDSLLFSPGGQRVAYIAYKGRNCLMVVDGREEPEFDSIMNFAPARLAFDSDDVLEYLAVKGGMLYRVRHSADAE